MHIKLDLPDGRRLVADVEPGNEVEGRALLRRLVHTAAPVAAGHSVDTGVDGAPVRLCAEGSEVAVETPGYFGASGRYTSALGATLRLLRAQQTVLRRVGTVAQPVDASHYLRISDAALSAVSAFGIRLADEMDGMSTGWTLTAAGETPTQSRFGQYTVREAAALRPEWLMALPLPPGWAFHYAGHTLLDCESPDRCNHVLMVSFDG